MAEKPQLSIVAYRKGMYIILEGNRDSERFFIIQQGTVQLSRGGEAFQQESSSTLNPGDFFGVISSMAQKSHLETAQALTDVTLVAANRSQFEGLIQYNTPIAMKVIQQFSRRMRYLNNELASLALQSSGAQNDAGNLFNAGQNYFKQKKYKIAAYAFKRYMQCYPKSGSAEAAAKNLTELAQYDKPFFTIGAKPFLRHYTNDSPVFLEGEPGEDLFIIQAGSIKITRFINNDEVILAILKQGDIFGEMSILESKPRSACAISSGDSTLMVVHKQNFEGMAAAQPQIISRLTQLLAERIWFGYKQLENAAIKDPLGRCFDYLFMHLERNNFQTGPRTTYIFPFGLEELAKMASIPEQDIRNVSRQILQNKKFTVNADGKIFVSEVTELEKLSEFYKKGVARAAARK
ncbi:MAG: cyclic nucleotide-binding domain-containing protein [Spirochaetaceae bacterium]|jgi:CRP-like cAMP-binding protein|nr:cyclic nucleotide-binding domain-containing protein [Spirochaetaceae bacterium]